MSGNSGKFDALRMSGTGSPDLILRGVKLMRITGGAFWFPKGAHYHLVISVSSVLSGLFHSFPTTSVRVRNPLSEVT